MWNLFLVWTRRVTNHRQRQEKQALRQRLTRRLFLEGLETRDLMAADVRTIDGTGNNLVNTAWGSAGSDLLRTAPAAYADGLSSPVVGSSTLPSARTISNTVSAQADDIISERQLSAMIYAWGQFLDHDLDLTPTGTAGEQFPVSVPAGDPQFDPAGTGTQTIPLTRSAFDAATGTTNVRQQINAVTAWLDGSQIYGSDAATADKLRTHVGGQLKTSDGNLLPYNNAATFPTGTVALANDSHIVADSQLFAAGDVRANENIELTSLHTLFVREHNRVAASIAAANPSLSDEAIYQQARARVIGELQVITYREWLPALLGQELRPYQGYNPRVNPGIANEFSTSAFRLGHSMLGDDVEFLDNNGQEVDEAIPLSQAFFNPPELTDHGIESILKYLASDPSSEVDVKVVDSVRNFLFGPPGAGGLDLVSLNIQRGRDHGIADYNTLRQAYGLPKVTEFSQITKNADLQNQLRTLYGNVNNIDAWVGELAEDHLLGSSVGPLVQRMLIDQFTRLRDADRFWYQRTFSGKELKSLEQTTLADVIRRNSSLTNLQGNVFFFKAEISGQVFRDGNRDARLNPGEPGLAGISVQLLAAETREVVATTKTDRQGMFRFDVGSGVRTGNYVVQEVLPSGATRTTPASPVISITRGDIKAGNVNIGLFSPGNPAPPPSPPPKPGNHPAPPPKKSKPHDSGPTSHPTNGKPAPFTPIVMAGTDNNKKTRR